MFIYQKRKQLTKKGSIAYCSLIFKRLFEELKVFYTSIIKISDVPSNKKHYGISRDWPLANFVSHSQLSNSLFKLKFNLLILIQKAEWSLGCKLIEKKTQISISKLNYCFPFLHSVVNLSETSFCHFSLKIRF